MATTFDLFFLGTSASFIDTVEGGNASENEGVFNGASFGSAGNPLALNLRTLSPGTQGPGTDGDAVSYGTDNNAFNEQFTINGGAPQTHDATMLYNNSVIRYTDGTTSTQQVIVMQDTAGNLYLLPPVTASAYSTALEAKPIESVTLGTALSGTGDTVYNMTADRYDLNVRDYVVEGTAGADNINASYAGDPDNDDVDAGDNLTGTNADSITAGAGNDTITAGAGNDTVRGEGDADSILGGSGNDVLDGGAGNDTINGEGSGTETANLTATNGDFSSGTTGWTSVGNGGVAGGRFLLDADSGTGEITYNTTLTGLNVGPGSNGAAQVLYDLSWNNGSPDNTSTRVYEMQINGVVYARFTTGGQNAANGTMTYLNGASGPVTTVPGNATTTITVNLPAGIPASGTLSFEATANSSLDDVGIDNVRVLTTVTSTDNDSLIGGDGDDVLIDGAGNDTLIGGAGNDSASAGTGNDYIDDAIGADQGTGNDTFDGGEGNDTIYGGLGNDSLIGGDGNDFVNGEEDNDTLTGGAGTDTLTGGLGDDIIDGGNDNDILYGDNETAANATVLNGGFDAGSANWTVGGAGSTFVYSSQMAFNASESVAGGVVSQVITVQQGLPYSLSVSASETGAGNFNHTLLVEVVDGGGNVIATQTQVITNGTTNQIITVPFTAYTPTVTLRFTNPTSTGTASSDLQIDTITVTGVAPTAGGDDVILGGAGDDTLFGTVGDDTLVGGVGADSLNGGTGLDIADYADSNAGVSVEISGSNLIAAGGTAAGDTGFAVDGVIGSNFNDTLIGSDGEGVPGPDFFTSVLDGGAGNDSIDGRGGDDSLYGGVGNDTILGGTGADVIEGDGMTTTFNPEAHASGPAGSAMTFNFTNASDETVRIHYINDAGQLVSLGTVPAGVTSWISTYVGTNWVVNDVATNEPLQYLGNPVDGSTVTYAHGADSIDGGDGNDTILAGGGDDTVFGGLGNDSIVLGDGNDSFGTYNADSGGDDTVYGGAGTDYIIGGGENDQLFGEAGDDTLAGGVGSDTLSGGDGADRFLITDDHDFDSIVGGEGGTDQDGITFGNFATTQGFNVTFTGAEQGTYAARGDAGTTGSFTQIEQITGTQYGDSIVGGSNTADMTVFGLDGDDTLSGGQGFNTLDGGAGNDLMIGGAASDSLIGGAGNDVFDGYFGNNTLDGGDGADTFRVFDDHLGDTVIGGEGGDDRDRIDFESFATTDGVDLTFTGNEAGNGTFGINSFAFTQVEELGLTSYDDTVDASATTVGVDIDGNAGNDLIIGGQGNDSLSGGQGNDIFRATGVANYGTDTIAGGDGYDIIDQTGFTGSNIVDFTGIEEIRAGENTPSWDWSGDTTSILYQGGTVGDAVVAGSGNDTLNGGLGDDTLDGNGGNDVINGGDGNDSLRGGGGNDSLTGGDGADTLDGEDGANTLLGGAGDDSFNVENDNLGDTIEGGIGYDIVDFSLASGTTGIDLTLSGNGAGSGVFGTNTFQFIEIEAFDLTTVDDTIDASATTQGVMIDGNSGNDQITGGQGDDTLQGGIGNDTFFLRDAFGNDSVDGDNDYDTIDLTALTNPVTVVFTAPGAGTITDQVTGDVINFSEIEQLILTNQDDVVDATLNDGYTYIQTRGGDDSVTGGTGNDVIDDELGVANGQGNDTFVGGDGADTLFGGTDNDSLVGGGGADTLGGEEGNDTLLGGAGGDSLSGGANDDSVAGGDDNDSIDGNTGNDVLAGDAGADTIAGSDGNDTIDGGTGNDSLTGGDGDDRFVLTDGHGADTITGGETGEMLGDTLDLSSVTAATTVDLTSATAGSGTITSGGSTATFSEIENIILGAGIDTVVLADGGGADTVAGFAAPTDNGDGTFTGQDRLDVSGLTDALGNPVNTADVTVADDGAGNAVLTFPNGESLTLIGVSPAAVNEPLALNAMGIPGPVEGTSGAEFIGLGFIDGDGDAITTGDDTIYGFGGNDNINGDAGNDSILAGDDNDFVAGGLGNDTLSGGSGDDYLTGNGDDDLLDGGIGADTLVGGTGTDAYTGGAGDDVILLNGAETAMGGSGDDFFGIDWTDPVADAAFTIDGGTDGTDGNPDDATNGDAGDLLDLSDVTDAVTVTLGTNPESGTVGGLDADAGTDITFTEIERIATGDGDDTIDGGAATAPMIVSTGVGADSVIGSSANDTVTTGTGADTVAGGVGDDTFDIGAGDGAVDVVVLADGDGADTITGFAAPIDNGDGTFTGQDRLDVSGLTSDGVTPVNLFDVFVIDDGAGNARLLFPGGETLTLIGVDPLAINSPAALNALGLPGPVDGTAGNDAITTGFVDAQGDAVDGADGVNDTIFGNDGNDTISSFAGADLVDGGAGDDVLNGGGGNDTLQGGTGDDNLIGSIGNDLLEGGDGDDAFHVDGGQGDDTIIGGEADENGARDWIDVDSTGPVTVIVSANETGTITADGSTITFSEIERINLDTFTATNDLMDATATTQGMYLGSGAGDDTILGGTGNDTLWGYTGNDSMVGGAGNDNLQGDPGNDTLLGGTGNDFVTGGDGDDLVVLENGFGNDALTAGEAGETLGDTLDASAITNEGVTVALVGTEAGTLTGTVSGDQVTFSQVENLVLTDAADAVQGALATGPLNVATGAGADTVAGGAGNDRFDIGAADLAVDVIVLDNGRGDDTITGFEAPIDNGNGTFSPRDQINVAGMTDLGGFAINAWDVTVSDTVGDGSGDTVLTFPDGTSVTLAGVQPPATNQIAWLESLGMPSAGPVDGAATAELMDVGFTDLAGDQIDGTDGLNDTINANDGDDTVNAGLGNDIVTGDAGNDSLTGGAGDDELWGGANNDTLNGGDGRDTLDGGDGDDLLITDGNDINDRPNLLIGGLGNDTIRVGGAFNGNDNIDGGDGIDTLELLPADDRNLTVNMTTGNVADGTIGTQVYTAVENITTGGGNDTILGDSQNNLLSGGAGADSLSGGDGADTLLGGTGADTLTGGAGADSIAGGDDADTIFGGAGDTVDGGNGGDDNDTLDMTGAALPGGSLYVEFDIGDPQAGTVFFRDSAGVTVDQMSFSEIENYVPCFTADTRIKTPRGEVRAADIKAGDLVLTRDNGLQAVRWVGARRLTQAETTARPHLAPVTFQPGSLGPNLPERALTVSPQHRMLVASARTQLWFGEDEVLAAAVNLTGLPGVSQAAADVTYVHILFDRHEIICGDGAWSESFQPGELALKGFDCDQRAEIAELFPELVVFGGQVTYPAARPTLRAHEACLLVG